MDSIHQSSISMSEYLGSNDAEACLKKLFESISTHLNVAQNKVQNDESDSLHDIVEQKLVDYQRTITDSNTQHLSPTTKQVNNQIKFELSTKVNNIKSLIKNKEKEISERNLITKRAVLNLMLKSQKVPAKAAGPSLFSSKHQHNFCKLQFRLSLE